MKVWSNSLIYLKLHLEEGTEGFEGSSSKASFEVWTLRILFEFFQVCFTFGVSINNLGSSRFGILVLCDRRRNCFANCIPEVISILEVISISWTICVGKHGNGPETIAFLKWFPFLRSFPFPRQFVLASMEMATSRLRKAWFESRQSNFFQVEQF